MLQEFIITKDKNGKQTSIIYGVLVSTFPIDSSNVSIIKTAAQAIWQKKISALML